uniref:Ig-like domain-containing protein n=1 Tax=Chelydra serpentina TaxID=8475 RepID=A0A8C3S9U8_CHESE
TIVPSGCAGFGNSIRNTMKVSAATVQEMREASPNILLKLRDQTVKFGDTAQFICALESEHFLEVLWTHNGERIKESKRMKLSQNGTVLLLTIINVQLLDQGLYRCTIRNDHGETTTAAVLTVEGGYLIFNIMTYLIST